LSLLRAGSWPGPEDWDFYNDFLELFLNHEIPGEESREGDRYRRVLEELAEAGAFRTGLSGSGSACFGLFPSPKAAAAAKITLKSHQLTVTETFFLRPPERGSTMERNMA
jgi:hypothetical protein